MPSDIRLDGEGVVVLANDLMLDFTRRRSSGNTDGMRRALTHDDSDGLTLNWDRDYPGGVTIQGEVSVPGVLDVEDARSRRFVLQVRRALPEPQVTQAPPVLKGTPDRRTPGFKRPSRTEVDLETELHLLWGEVQRLRTRLSELEAQP